MAAQARELAWREARSAERRTWRKAAARTRHSPAPAFGRFADRRVDPYGGPDWTHRRLAGWDGLLGEDRAGRLMRARAAGYSLMRLRTYQYPDGSRVQHLIPYDDGAAGDE